MNGFTSARQRVERAAREFIASNGYAPTVRDIAAAAELAPSYVYRNLQDLRTSGVLTWDEGRPRTLRFLDAKSEGV